MTANQEKLINVLKDMFRFDQADLDFGIYRIMRMKRDQITRFVEEELPSQITEGLLELARLEKANETEAIDKEIADTKAASYSESVKAIAIAELEERKKETLAGILDVTSIEADIYSHLTNFLSRYYDEGDFISQRRYKDGVYAIPYEGEEVKLHWANADQYYVKTSEYFKDYAFKTVNGCTIRFKLVEAETDLDNNKSNEKRFFQLHTENPFAVVDGELTIYLEYKNGGRKNQAECTTEIVSAFCDVLNQPKYKPFSTILMINDDKTLLERQLNQYSARNTFDYFIHKDLGKFLNRELDFYIKNDVIFLDDIDEMDEAKTKEYLTKAKVIRKIARKIIAFLAQIENFQKKLYLKKKFVVETNYCITLDRVSEALYPEIAANDMQREEWVRLFAIDEITGGDMFTVPYSAPLTVEFLKGNPFLVLDTAFFSMEFKEKLVDSIDGLDENLDGLMIHSESFQALRLLQEKYRKSIECVYIDPPYNTDASPIIYKNGYKDASWLSIMYDRYLCMDALLPQGTIATTAIDHAELFNLGKTLSIVYGDDNRIAIVTVQHNPKGRNQAEFFSENTEYLLVYTNNIKRAVFNEVAIDESTMDTFDESDENGKFRWEPYIRARTTWSRENRPDNWYPIYVSPDLKEITSAYHEGYYEVYPKTNTGDFSWKNIRVTFNELNRNGYFKAEKENGKVVIYHQYRENQVLKNLWIEKKYQSEFNGTNLLKAMFGKAVFTYPKSVYAVSDIIKITSPVDGVVLDYFAGSGTTGHAVINLNREDGGNRKYFLVEMGEYFDTVTKPRIQKAIYSMDTEIQKGWKDGKPVSRKGSSHAFKYIRLESYEDTLNNIVLRNGDYDLLGAAREEYMLSYMLDTEAEGPSLLNIDALNKPFSYKMNITRNFVSSKRTIDLVETFNYLIGLTANRCYAFSSYDADFTDGQYGSVTALLKEGNTYKFKATDGSLPNGDKALIIWREMTDDMIKDNAALDAYFLSLPNSRSYRKIYVNCNNNLLNLRYSDESWQVILIDEEMKKRMFDIIE